LGIDLMPQKTCTYDCIYCQIMINTTCKTTERKEWVPLEEVIKQVRKKITCQPLDTITITGCGEPTLYSRLGELIEYLKNMTDTKISVLTNGSLLWIPEVRNELVNADIVMPNLDAFDDATFHKINRPHKNICFKTMIEGLIEFGEMYNQEYWLEIFLLEDITANESHIEKLVSIANRISPDLIQLNTVTKPSWDYCPATVSKEKMDYYAKLFGPKAQVIAKYAKFDKKCEFPISKGNVLKLLKKQSSTLDDISDYFGINRMEAIKLIEGLCSEEEIKSELKNDQVYYWF